MYRFLLDAVATLPTKPIPKSSNGLCTWTINKQTVLMMVLWHNFTWNINEHVCVFCMHMCTIHYCNRNVTGFLLNGHSADLAVFALQHNVQKKITHDNILSTSIRPAYQWRKKIKSIEESVHTHFSMSTPIQAKKQTKKLSNMTSFVFVPQWGPKALAWNSVDIFRDK